MLPEDLYYIIFNILVTFTVATIVSTRILKQEKVKRGKSLADPPKQQHEVTPVLVADHVRSSPVGSPVESTQRERHLRTIAYEEAVLEEKILDAEERVQTSRQNLQKAQMQHLACFTQEQIFTAQALAAEALYDENQSGENRESFSSQVDGVAEDKSFLGQYEFSQVCASVSEARSYPASPKLNATVNNLRALSQNAKRQLTSSNTRMQECDKALQLSLRSCYKLQRRVIQRRLEVLRDETSGNMEPPGDDQSSSEDGVATNTSGQPGLSDKRRKKLDTVRSMTSEQDMPLPFRTAFTSPDIDLAAVGGPGANPALKSTSPPVAISLPAQSILYSFSGPPADAAALETGRRMLGQMKGWWMTDKAMSTPKPPESVLQNTLVWEVCAEYRLMAPHVLFGVEVRNDCQLVFKIPETGSEIRQTPSAGGTFSKWWAGHGNGNVQVGGENQIISPSHILPDAGRDSQTFWMADPLDKGHLQNLGETEADNLESRSQHTSCWISADGLHVCMQTTRTNLTEAHVETIVHKWSLHGKDYGMMMEDVELWPGLHQQALRWRNVYQKVTEKM